MLESPSTLLPPSVLTALFWALIVACALAQVFIVRAVFRTLPAAPASASVPTPRRWAEIVQVILPVIGLVAMFYGAWRLLPVPVLP